MVALDLGKAPLTCEKIERPRQDSDLRRTDSELVPLGDCRCRWTGPLTCG